MRVFEKLKIKSARDVGILLLKARTFIVLIILATVFALLQEQFLTIGSLTIVTKHVARYAILAIGMTYVIVTGGIDLSVGGVAGLSAMIAGMLVKNGLVLSFLGVTVYFNVVLVVLIAIIVGAFLGWINGLVVSKLNVPAFIATLGMLNVCKGLSMATNGGKTFSELKVADPEFAVLGTGDILGIPVIIWTMVALALIAAYVFKKTPLGWHVYATGGNEKAARLSGINTDKTKIFVYILSGCCAALAGVFAASELNVAHPGTGTNEAWEMNAIAAAVLGGTSMAGGIGNIGGTIIGAFVIGVLTDGMVMVGWPTFIQMIIKGVVIVGAVVLDQSQREFQRKLALSRKEN